MWKARCVQWYYYSMFAMCQIISKCHTPIGWLSSVLFAVGDHSLLFQFVQMKIGLFVIQLLSAAGVVASSPNLLNSSWVWFQIHVFKTDFWWKRFYANSSNTVFTMLFSCQLHTGYVWVCMYLLVEVGETIVLT